VSDRLEEIQKRADAASPGPWKVFINPLRDLISKNDPAEVLAQIDSDTDFASHARDDIPWLLAEVDRLKFVFYGMAELLVEKAKAPCARCEALGKTPGAGGWPRCAKCDSEMVIGGEGSYCADCNPEMISDEN
jgi:hypothetical protein